MIALIEEVGNLFWPDKTNNEKGEEDVKDYFAQVIPLPAGSPTADTV